MPMADGRVKDAVLKHHRREFGGIFCYSVPITIRRHAGALQPIGGAVRPPQSHSRAIPTYASLATLRFGNGRACLGLRSKPPSCGIRLPSPRDRARVNSQARRSEVCMYW